MTPPGYLEAFVVSRRPGTAVEGGYRGAPEVRRNSSRGPSLLLSLRSNAERGLGRTCASAARSAAQGSARTLRRRTSTIGQCPEPKFAPDWRQNSIRELRVQKGTRIMKLPAVFGFRSSYVRMPRVRTNFGIGPLVAVVLRNEEGAEFGGHAHRALVGSHTDNSASPLSCKRAMNLPLTRNAGVPWDVPSVHREARARSCARFSSVAKGSFPTLPNSCGAR